MQSMQCTNCNTELPANAKFCLECAAPVLASAGIRVNQEIGSVKGSVTGAVLGDDAPPAGLNVAASQKVESVESGGTVVGAVVGEHAQVGGQRQYGDNIQGNKRVVNTDGGANIEGSVNVHGGDFVGRDKINSNIKVGNITDSTGIGIGNNVHVNVNQTSGVSADEIAGLFALIYQQIGARKEDPLVDKEELTQAVQRIEGETLKGEQANPDKMQRLLKTLAAMASDIGDVVIAALTSPAAGIAMVVRKVAEETRKRAH
jgi:hypothetical protein